MLNKAIEKAKTFLDDKSLQILRYAETKDYYLFEYGAKNGKSVFDNTLIQVKKIKNMDPCFYIITEHLEELNELEFKLINTK